jgi:hypothetical protein
MTTISGPKGRFLSADRPAIAADYLAGMRLKEICAKHNLAGNGPLCRIVREMNLPRRKPHRPIEERLGIKKAEADIEARGIENETDTMRADRLRGEDEAFRLALVGAHPHIPQGPNRAPSTRRPRTVPRPIHVRSADGWQWPEDCGA